MKQGPGPRPVEAKQGSVRTPAVPPAHARPPADSPRPRLGPPFGVSSLLPKAHWIQEKKLAAVLAAFLVRMVELVLGPSMRLALAAPRLPLLTPARQVVLLARLLFRMYWWYRAQKAKGILAQASPKSPSSSQVRSSTCTSSQLQRPIRASSPIFMRALIWALACSSAISESMVLKASSTASRK